jgi:probable rRNA maturation factor
MDVEELSVEHTEASGPPRPDANGVGALLGDVVLCPKIAAEQARHAGHSTESELQLLCTHGILHLLGYDHGEPEEEREMFALQARLVGGWAERSGRPPIRAPRPGTRGEARDIATDARSGDHGG